MAYTTYDTGYNNQFGYPLQHSLSHGPVYGVHPTEYGYQDPAYGGAVYSEVSMVSERCGLGHHTEQTVAWLCHGRISHIRSSALCQPVRQRYGHSLYVSSSF